MSIESYWVSHCRLSRSIRCGPLRERSVSHGAELYQPRSTRQVRLMADPMMLADARTARLVKSSTMALELVGRSVAIVRIQELIRRAAQVDGGVLLIADRGADVESVALELHERARRPAAAFIHVACSSGDPARLDAL